MSKTKRHITKTKVFQTCLAWVLFVLFTFNSFLSFIFFEYRLSQIRHDVKENIISQIPHNQLVEIIKPLNFSEHEFELNGIMYDVVEKKIVDGKLKLLCFADLNETEINHKLDKQIEKNLDNNPIKKDNDKKIIDCIKIIYVEVFFEKISFLSYQSITNSNFKYYQFVNEVSINTPSPPPKC